MYRYEQMIKSFQNFKEFKGYIEERGIINRLWFEKEIQGKIVLFEFKNGLTDTMRQPKVYQSLEKKHTEIEEKLWSKEVIDFVTILRTIIDQGNEEYESILPQKTYYMDDYIFRIKDFFESNIYEKSSMKYPEELIVNIQVEKNDLIICHIDLVIEEGMYHRGNYPCWKISQTKWYTSVYENEIDNTMEELKEVANKMNALIERELNRSSRLAHINKKGDR